MPKAAIHGFVCRAVMLAQAYLPPSGFLQRDIYRAMAIAGEVHVRNFQCLPTVTHDNGRSTIVPIECKIIGTGHGSARIKASVRCRIEYFDGEEWRIITMTVDHFDSRFQHKELFAASCGSIGDFTDIKKYNEGYAIPPQMLDFSCPIRNLDGTFYERVYPFDPYYFCANVHPTGAFLFTPHHSQLTLLQHLCIQFQYASKPLQLFSDIPKYWIEDDGTMCLDEEHSPWAPLCPSQHQGRDWRPGLLCRGDGFPSWLTIPKNSDGLSIVPMSRRLNREGSADVP